MSSSTHHLLIEGEFGEIIKDIEHGYQLRHFLIEGEFGEIREDMSMGIN